MDENERRRLIADIKVERAALDALQAPVSRATIEGLIGWLDSKLAELVESIRT